MEPSALIIGYFISALICGFVCTAIASNRGMRGGFWWGFWLSIIGIIVVALRPNDSINIAEASSSSAAVPVERDTKQADISSPKEQNVYSEADEILKFKSLADRGIITQREFEAKKRQLLGISILPEKEEEPWKCGKCGRINKGYVIRCECGNRNK